MKQWMKFAALPSLVLALTLAACENINTEPQLAPKDEIHRLLAVVQGNGYTIVKEKDLTVGTVSATIGVSGGRLELGRNVLEVPAGAVDAPTLFSMSKLDGDHVQVDLTATQLLPNDVGARGFKVPLNLRLSYAGATEMPSESALQVGWIKPDGSVELQPSEVDVSGKLVKAKVGHFSIYGVIYPEAW